MGFCPITHTGMSFHSTPPNNSAQYVGCEREIEKMHIVFA